MFLITQNVLIISQKGHPFHTYLAFLKHGLRNSSTSTHNALTFLGIIPHSTFCAHHPKQMQELQLDYFLLCLYILYNYLLDAYHLHVNTHYNMQLGYPTKCVNCNAVQIGDQLPVQYTCVQLLQLAFFIAFSVVNESVLNTLWMSGKITFLFACNECPCISLYCSLDTLDTHGKKSHH